MEFDESKVINALHTEKAVVGKKYWFADTMVYLKKQVEDSDAPTMARELMSVIHSVASPFYMKSSESAHPQCCCLLYPYEEPEVKLMTCRQLAEWLAKGNGQAQGSTGRTLFTALQYDNGESDTSDLVIRSWNSDRWIQPAEEIYLRDCKGGKE